ncbi:hypothetical protein GOP47_0012864 [Adiantum capillus-veneris]|uniref:Uncharacterized protein n=1 Tax=Adiantum capillus-veneris TaxID=13818 RepID=A0A9D4ZEQ4_ADICA|nr:hypothetical protein GOP47_0012864 [Adiantum capillus-veneris]
MSVPGAACSRPFYSVEHVRALLQTAASSSLSASSSWARRRHYWDIKRRADRAWLVRQQDEGELFKHHWFSHSQQCISSFITFRSRLREGGANSDSKGDNHYAFSKKSALNKEPSLLLSLVQEIQPLDVSQISKEASPDSMDAMKRTISGMLGLLPSDQFQVTVETSREPLAKLLVSSMMTGYTLRNAEYRLCLQKSLESSDDEDAGRGPDIEFVKQKLQFGEVESILEPVLHEEENSFFTGKALEAIQGETHVFEDELSTLEPVGPLSEEAKNYIHYLKQQLESVSKELEDTKKFNTGIQVQNMVGEEKNDLLDYLRSLAPEKVAELSQPTSSEVEDVIQHVITELLDNPSTKLQHKSSQFGSQASPLNGSWEGNFTQKYSSSPLQSQAMVTVNRDHLARLLFWCMLLGHHMRGLEYRLELSRTLSLSGEISSSRSEKREG